jgi:hypothetical protein
MVHHPEESRAVALAAAARPLVPTDQLADVQCSFGLFGEYGQLGAKDKDETKTLKNSFIHYMSLEASSLH